MSELDQMERAAEREFKIYEGKIADLETQLAETKLALSVQKADAKRKMDDYRILEIKANTIENGLRKAVERESAANARVKELEDVLKIAPELVEVEYSEVSETPLSLTYQLLGFMPRKEMLAQVGKQFSSFVAIAYIDAWTTYEEQRKAALNKDEDDEAK